jgi:hypothetical protein
MRALLVGAFAALLVTPSASGWSWPVDGPVLRPFVFGGNPYAGGQHRGIAIGAPAGSTVVAPASGTVSFVGSVPGGGRAVTIRTPDGYSTTLVHLGSIGVLRGALVEEGAAVGTVGPSGTPEFAEPYLHLGIRVTAEPEGYVDPLGFLPPRPMPAPPPAVPVDAVPGAEQRPAGDAATDAAAGEEPSTPGDGSSEAEAEAAQPVEADAAAAEADSSESALQEAADDADDPGGSASDQNAEEEGAADGGAAVAEATAGDDAAGPPVEAQAAANLAAGAETATAGSAADQAGTSSTPATATDEAQQTAASWPADDPPVIDEPLPEPSAAVTAPAEASPSAPPVEAPAASPAPMAEAPTATPPPASHAAEVTAEGLEQHGRSLPVEVSAPDALWRAWMLDGSSLILRGDFVFRSKPRAALRESARGGRDIVHTSAAADDARATAAARTSRITPHHTGRAVAPAHDPAGRPAERRAEARSAAAGLDGRYLLAFPLLLGLALAAFLVHRSRLRRKERGEPVRIMSILERFESAEDPGRRGVALCERAAAHRPRGGIRGSVGHLRALPPLEGERRPHGQRDRRARDAGDGRRGQRRRLAA